MDSSTRIGSGHVMRCITLAKSFRIQNIDVTFICMKLPGNINNVIEQYNFSLLEIDALNPKDGSYKNNHEIEDAHNTINLIKDMEFDLLIVDHYELSHIWEKKLQNIIKHIMVIDDLADRKHACSFLLDQNYNSNIKGKYAGLLPKNCIEFIGPRYAILDESFQRFQKLNKQHNALVKNILVFFGSYDMSGETLKVLEAFSKINIDKIDIHVVVGTNNPNKKRVKNICYNKNYNYHCQVNNMAELIFNADLGIGASGASTWERCILGLPTITTIVADNQIDVAHELHNIKAICLLGEKDHLASKDYAQMIQKLILNSSQREQISLNARKIVSIGTDFLTRKILKRVSEPFN